jgi:glutamate-5-semialdehyde dehydrogenase
MKLGRLTAGMPIPFGGDRVAFVPEELAAAFTPGDRLIVVQETGDLLRVPAEAAERAAAAVARAQAAFRRLSSVSDGAIERFFEGFAARLEDDAVWDEIAAINGEDVSRARMAGRSTTRLQVTADMRAGMITGLRGWRDTPPARGRLVEQVDHRGWSVALETAPLGVVGFVFEGRPNVFADACGVIRSGNTAVFRIGSDALRTARAIAEGALAPALADARLPEGTAVLLDAPERAAGWALFADPRLALAVARGSGPAVGQLGAVARQSGIPVSLHGTGGAWLVADVSAEPGRFAAAVVNSLDRKVCNTLNVCCVPRARAADLVPLFAETLWRLGEARGHGAKLHVGEESAMFLPERWRTARLQKPDGNGDAALVEVHQAPDLGHEWEWETMPEVWLAVVDDLDDAVARFNVHSPRFIASLISADTAAHDRFYAQIEAAFVGDGFTRWVDGQYAFNRPELGLSNWQSGRLLARGGVLSGDGAVTLRVRMRQFDMDLRR